MTSITGSTRLRRVAASAATLALVLLASSVPRAAGAAGAATGGPVPVVVRERPGAGDLAERAVRALGGELGQTLAIIDGFAATVPADAVARLAASPGVRSVTPNRPVQLSQTSVRLSTEPVDEQAGGMTGDAGYKPKSDPNSLYWVAQEVTGAGEYWNDGFTGRGVGVALLDSGVAPVDGLTAPGKVLHGPDLSFESQVEGLHHLDTYGHGTHMAGIIAGRDDAAPTNVQKGDERHFLGVAPGARIVSVKVAGANGVTDVSQVIAGIDWVVQHRDDPGMNIRVLNLSFGTDGVQDYRLDPLTYAVEVAWRHGIVVVVAGGNAGFGSARLNNPAYDPYVIAVGAADGRGTYGAHDDVVASFSSRGDAARRPDLVAPGASIASLRAPGSLADLEHPEARVGQRLLRGSGTSQAAAVVSGAAALVLQQRPRATPDQVKALLTRTAQLLPNADPLTQGAGMLDLKVARGTATPRVTQTWTPATGLGSLDAARGSLHLVTDGVELRGEADIFGVPWNAPAWSAASGATVAWSGGTWNGSSWSGSSWSGSSWSGSSWSGSSWSGSSWSGSSWSGSSWSGSSWSGSSWSGSSWSGSSWSSAGWG